MKIPIIKLDVICKTGKCCMGVCEVPADQIILVKELDIDSDKEDHIEGVVVCRDHLFDLVLTLISEKAKEMLLRREDLLAKLGFTGSATIVL